MTVRNTYNISFLRRAVVLLILGPALAPVSNASVLEDLPDWNDESNAYAAWGLSTSGSASHISDGRYSASELEKFTGLASISDTHDDTEGDDLWTAYQMYRRLNGIHQNAANAWYVRAQNLAGFFKNNYVRGSGWAEDANFNHDHMYGWGLCNWAEGEVDIDAIATVDQIVAEMVSWNAGSFVVNPGGSLFYTGSGGRRWARQLRFAVCAAELSPSTANRNWRNKVIDIVMQSPEWDPAHNMYWLREGPTNNGGRLGAGAYESGDRIAINFHMGIWMEALWQAWRSLDAENDGRAAAVRQRIVNMASFFRDIPLDSDGFLRLNLGYNIETGQPIIAGGTGSPKGVYSISPVNGLVFAYKLSGDQSYLNRAWELYENWQAARAGIGGVIDHYVDTQLASATGFRFLANNKGELQYVYALFENGGNPKQVGVSSVQTRPLPPVLFSDPTDQAVSVTLDTSPRTIDSGMSSLLTWSSTEATSCAASKGWSGPRPPNGSEVTDALVVTTEFELTCTDNTSTVSASVTVTINPPGDGSAKLPSWYASSPDKTWIDMSSVGASTFADNDPVKKFPDWDLGQTVSGSDYHTAVIGNWNGAVARENFFVIGLSGGHRGSPQNTIYEFGPFTSETPDWHWYGTDTSKYDIPSHGGTPNPTIADWTNEENVSYYSDGKPSAAHTYDHQCFIPELGNGVGNVLFEPFRAFVYSGSNQTSSIRLAIGAFRFQSTNDFGGDYVRQGTFSKFSGSRGPGGVVEWDSNRQLVWAFTTGSGPRQLHSYNPITNSWSLHSDSFSGSYGNDTGGGSIDPERQIMIIHAKPDGLVVIDLSPGREGDDVFISSNYTGFLKTAGDIGIEYEPVGKQFVGYDGGDNLYTLEPPSNYRNGNGSLNSSASWSWVPVTNGTGGATPSSAAPNGTYGRFRYISSIKAFAVINSPSDAMFVYKIPTSGL